MITLNWYQKIDLSAACGPPFTLLAFLTFVEIAAILLNLLLLDLALKLAFFIAPLPELLLFFHVLLLFFFLFFFC